MVEIALAAEAQFIECEPRCGLQKDSAIQYAKNAQQAFLIRTLLHQPYKVSALKSLLEKELSSSSDAVSLLLAEFVLDFGEYLKNG